METRVLVIEDDQEINELLGEYLSLEGIGYEKALNGEQGIRLANGSHPDAIVLDLMLPDIDGYEVCSRLKSARDTRNIPIIILSCMCQEDDRFRALASGAFRFMNKPFLPDDLLDNLRLALESRSATPVNAPAGEVLISAADSAATVAQLNVMLTSIGDCSTLSETHLAQLREAFIGLSEWVLAWGKQHGADAALRVRYVMNGCVDHTPASEIVWTIDEPRPGILAALVFQSAVGGGHFGLSYSSSNGSGEKSVGPLDGWYQFIAKTGAGQFDKQPAEHVIRLTRTLMGSDVGLELPTVTVGGTRYPDRLAAEARGAKR